MNVESIFSDTGMDIEMGGTIFQLLNLYDADMNNPRRFNMIKDVARYFRRQPEYEWQILKVISNKPGVDKLELLWTYTQLRSKQDEYINQLEMEIFDEEIKELKEKNGLTTDLRTRMREGLEEEGEFDEEFIQKVEHNKQILDKINLISKELNAYDN